MATPLKGFYKNGDEVKRRILFHFPLHPKVYFLLPKTKYAPQGWGDRLDFRVSTGGWGGRSEQRVYDLKAKPLLISEHLCKCY